MHCPKDCGSADLPRDMVDDHLTNHCPLAEISCSFSTVGCPFKVWLSSVLQLLTQSCVGGDGDRISLESVNYSIHEKLLPVLK